MKARHNTKTADMKSSSQRNNGAETTSDCTLSPNTTYTPQIDTAVNDEVNGRLPDTP